MYYMGCFLEAQLNPVDMYAMYAKYFTNLHCGSRVWKQLSDSN